MMTRKSRLYLLMFLLFFLTGCAGIQKSVDRYQACIEDPACLAQMEDVKQVSYDVTKVAASGFPISSIPDAIAYIASNVIAFGFGVLKGKKKG